MRRLLKKFHDAVFAWLNRNRLPIYVTCFILLFIVVYFFNRIFVVIPPGHKGVLFKVFTGGTVVSRDYGEGLTVVFPWDKIYPYDIRIQESKVFVSVLSTDGLIIEVVLSVRYHPKEGDVGELHKKVGPDYERRIIRPLVVEAVRKVVGGYRPEELYTTHRHLLAEQILALAQNEIAFFPLILDGIVVESVKLPDSINKAIEEKIKQQQLYLAYDFILRRAKQEVERKKLEAEGIQQYNNIISSSLSDQMLTWLGIRATKELAQSENAKILLFGGKDGLPVILNLDEGKKGAAPEKAAAAPQAPEGAFDSPELREAEQQTSMGDESPLPTGPPMGKVKIPVKPRRAAPSSVLTPYKELMRPVPVDQ